MRPQVGRVLQETLVNLATDVLPTIQPAFRQGALGTQLMLLATVAEEFERAAARRVEENQALRVIFASAQALPLDPDLGVRLAEASLREDPDLRVTVLDAANDELRALLIELHAAVEALDGPVAQEIEEAIWQELALSTERRKISTAPF